MEKYSAQVVNSLEEVINILEQGWHQGSLFEYDANNKPKSCCLVGAIFLMCNSTMRGSLAARALRDTLLKSDFVIDVENRKDSLAQFNDFPGRTVEEVIDLVKTSIENIKAKLKEQV